MVIIFVVLFLFGFIIGVATYEDGVDDNTLNIVSSLAFYTLYIPIYFVLTTRRFHDLGRSNWHFLTLLIPFYSIYVGLELLFRSSNKGENIYGQEYEGIKLGRIFMTSRDEVVQADTPKQEIVESTESTRPVAPIANADELMKYGKMYKAGLLTKAEWEAKKKQLL